MPTPTLIRGKWIVTGADETDAVLSDAAVAVAGDTVVAVDGWDELRQRHPEAAVLGGEHVAVLPGLVNAHHHSNAVSSIQHGVSDDLLEPWILAWRAMRSGDAHLDALLASAAQMRTGVTTVVNMHNCGDGSRPYLDTCRAAIAGFDRAGLRVAYAPGAGSRSRLVHGAGEDRRFIDALPADLRTDAEVLLPGPEGFGEAVYLEVLETLHAELAGHERIRLLLGPQGPQWVSEDLLVRLAELAERWDTGLQTHVCESFYEKLHGPREYDCPTVLHLQRLGVLSPRLSIAHGVWLTDAEIEVLASSGAAISHNPSSNLRLRAGVAPLNELLAAGVTVGLGMDGTTLNEDEDMFTEMRLALRLQRTPRIGGPAPTPRQVFALATRGGARLLRREGRLGRLAPGFAADLVMVDTERVCWPWVAPRADVLELLLMRLNAGDVRSVMVGGELVFEDGRPTRFDLAEAGRELAERINRQADPVPGAEFYARLASHLEAWYRRWPAPPLEPRLILNSRR